jgi:transcriptional regulator with XRE-family HTH domain
LKTVSVARFAEQVKKRRQAAELSQQALAAAAGLSISVVAQIEQGVRPNPKLNTVYALALALGTGVDDLIGHEPAPAPAAKRKERQP